MNALELLERDYLEKRKKLEQQLIISNRLPTNDKTMRWIGENGWNNKGEPNPSAEKTCPILPYLFHGPSTYTNAQHISYKAPDSMKWTNGQGESTSSKFRLQFVNQYVLTVVDIYREYLISTKAVKSFRYTGYFPSGFDFTRIREYGDGHIIGEGKAEISVSRHVGEYSFTSGSFNFHVDIEGLGIMKIDIETPGMERLAPIPKGVNRYGGGNGPVSSVTNWEVPQLPHRPIHISNYAGGDRANRSRSLRYLFATVDDALSCLGILDEGK